MVQGALEGFFMKTSRKTLKGLYYNQYTQY